MSAAIPESPREAHEPSKASPEQRRFVGVNQKPHGCWVACIASITGIPHDAFPEAPPLAAGEKFECDYTNAVTRVLKAHGWQRHHLWTDATMPPSGWAIAGGPGPRGVHHGVVVFDGTMVWDPHPSRAGLLSVDDYELLVPMVPNALPPLPRESAVSVPPSDEERKALAEWNVARKELFEGRIRWDAPLNVGDKLASLLRGRYER